MSRSSDLIGIAALAGAAGLGYLIWKNGSTLKGAADAVGSGIKTVGNATADVVKISADDPAVNVQTAGKIITPWGFLGSLVGTPFDKKSVADIPVEDLVNGDYGITGKTITPEPDNPLYEISQAIKALPTSEPVAAAATTKAAAAATPIRSEPEPASTPVYSTQTEKILANTKSQAFTELQEMDAFSDHDVELTQDPVKDAKLSKILPKALRKAGTAGIITALRKGLINT